MLITIDLKILIQRIDKLLLCLILSVAFQDRLNERVFCLLQVFIHCLALGIFLVLFLAPAALNESLHDHGVAGKNISREVWELLGLVVIIWVLRVLDGVLDQLLKRSLLTNELDKFGLATSSTENDEPFLFVEELLDCAALLLVQKLVDLYVSSLVEYKV